MAQRIREKVKEADYRTEVIGAPVNAAEKAEFTRAAQKAGYKRPGACAREVLLGWARGELGRVKRPAGGGPPSAVQDIVSTLQRQGKI